MNPQDIPNDHEFQNGDRWVACALETNRFDPLALAFRKFIALARVAMANAGLSAPAPYQPYLQAPSNVPPAPQIVVQLAPGYYGPPQPAAPPPPVITPPQIGPLQPAPQAASQPAPQPVPQPAR